MSSHNNPSINERVRRTFNLLNGNELSNEIAPFIQPTIEIKPKLSIIKSVGLDNSSGTTGNIWTTPSDKDFYLYALVLDVIKDVTATSNFSSIIATIDGVATTLLRITSLTLTAQSEGRVLYLPLPIKLDRNTAITHLNGSAVANISSRALIYGYLEEVKSNSMN